MKHARTEPKKSHTVLWILLVVFCVLGVLGGVAAAFLLPALRSPERLFHGEDNTQEFFPGLEAGERGAMPEGVVNFLLLGVENKSGEGASYQGVSPGQDAHTDVVIVASVDFIRNTVDLISLPRDTFIVCDGIRGCYKLNSVINYGGGKNAEDDSAFLGVCAVASHLLGGLPVDYYFGVDYEAVIGIVDAIGGVDFEMDMDYSCGARHYSKGPVHLDGVGVLDYLRARMNAEGAHDDASRVVRQKRMLSAILAEAQRKGVLASLPGLLSSIAGRTYTNLSFQQLTALAAFAGNVDTSSMGMYAFSGEVTGAMPGGGAPDGWSFCFPDEANRAEVMETVYGITPEPLRYCSYEFSVWLRWNGFSAWNALYNASLLSEWAVSASLPDDAREALSRMEQAAEGLQAAYNAAALSLSDEDTWEMDARIEELRSATDDFSYLAGYPVEYTVGVRDDWYNDISINAVIVDFN